MRRKPISVLESVRNLATGKGPTFHTGTDDGYKPPRRRRRGCICRSDVTGRIHNDACLIHNKPVKPFVRLIVIRNQAHVGGTEILEVARVRDGEQPSDAFKRAVKREAESAQCSMADARSYITYETFMLTE